MPSTPTKAPRYAALILAVLAGLMLAACGKGSSDSAGAGPVSATTIAANASVAKSLLGFDSSDAEEAQRGLIARPQGKVLAADGSVVWDYDKFVFAQGAAPGSVNPSLWRHATLNNHTGLFKVSTGIYQLRGFDLANMSLIEGKSGWIVVDPLTTRETATAALAFARRHLGDKPVSAIIFTHSHVDHFGGALGIVSGEEAAKRKLPIVAPQGFLHEATSENILVGPAMGRRALYQFGNTLPASATGTVNAGLGQAVALGQIGILPPNQIIDHTPQELLLDGVRIIFQNVPGSEAPAELAFYLPELKAYCGAEIMVPSLHNLYTLRGAKVRDSLRWAGYIDEALVRFGDAEIFFASHLWPTWGNERIVRFMKRQRDTYKFIHDQTVQMINAGLKPNEIAEQIKLPASLTDNYSVRGYYGTLKHDARAVYQHYMGWFDGNPANLDLLPRTEAATRYVALMGGSEQILRAAQSAYDQGEFRWVAELLNHLVFAEPGNQKARELLASAYDQLGFMAESAIWRNFYLTGAMELRTRKLGESTDPALAIDMLAFTPVESFLEAWAAALNARKAEGKTLRINMAFTDAAGKGEDSYVLWIENSVLHFRKDAADPSATANIALSRRLFLKMMTGTAGITDLLGSGQIKLTGSKLDVLSFFTLMEKPPRTFPIVTP